jgi:hypothetical protein
MEKMALFPVIPIARVSHDNFSPAELQIVFYYLLYTLEAAIPGSGANL